MFVRIDKDLSVNVQNIFSYKLSEDHDSYKLQIWSSNGNIIHTVIYLKDRPDQMKILIEFNNLMRDLTTNLDIVKDEVGFGWSPNETTIDEDKRIEEHLDISDVQGE